MSLNRTFLIITMFSVLISGFYFAFSEIQIKAVYHHLVDRTSVDFANVLVIVLSVLSGAFLFLVHALRLKLRKICAHLLGALLKLNTIKFIFLIISLIVVGHALTLFLDYSPVTDGLWFHETAISLATDNTFRFNEMYTAYRFPGYPFLLSLGYRVFGSYLIVSWCLNLVASFLIALLVYKITVILYNSQVARVATIGISLHPALILFSGIPMSDVVFTAGTLFVIYLTLLTQYSLWGAALIGVVLGGVVLIKSTAFILLIVMVLIWKTVLNSWSAAARLIAVVILALMITVSPWSMRNLTIIGTPALSTNFGINLLRGNHQGASGGWQQLPVNIPIPDDFSNTEVDVNKLYRNEAISHILAEPLEVIMRIPKKVLRFYTTENTAVTLYYQGQQKNTLYSKYILYALAHIFHSVLLILFILRIFQLLSTNKQCQTLTWIPWSIIVLNTLIVIVFFGSSRYRLPITPWIMIESCAYLLTLSNHCIWVKNRYTIE